MNAEQIALRIEVLAKGFHNLEKLIQPPFHFNDKGGGETYRFGKPGILQFITIHFGQILSHWSVVYVLVKLGFQYEIMILSRSIFESETKIGFVLTGINGAKFDRKQRRFLERYFADNERWDTSQRTNKTTPQKQVIEENVASFRKDMNMLKDWGIQNSPGVTAKDFEIALEDIYRAGSNFAHGRYPELMYFFEGDDPVFSIYGLRDAASSKTIIENVYLSLDRSLELLVESIMKLSAAGYIDKNSNAMEWVLFGSGIESEEIALTRAVWVTGRK